MRRTVGTCFVLMAVASSMVYAGRGLAPESAREPTGFPQLVSVESLQMCASFSPAAAVPLLTAFRQDRPQVASTTNYRTLERAPLRTIRDSFPTYSAVAVDMVNNEIVLQDENLFQIMVYDRMANTPPAARLTEPKRVIGGHETKVEFNCGLYIDPKTGDIYSVNNDTLDTLSIFSRNARGNAHPDRTLHTPHGTYGIAVNEETQELYLTVQHQNAVVVHRKMAQGQEKPIRVWEGAHVGLADPHGIGIDIKNQLMFVANYGNAKSNQLPGSGTFVSPSINVYPLKAGGDTPPLRVLTGPRTQLNRPAHVYLDQHHGEVFVANDGENSIIVFRLNDNCDVAPTCAHEGV